MGKIIDYSNLKKYQEEFNNKKTVLVGGCFDLIHYGHFQFLKKAKKTGDYLIVVLESDEFIKKSKKRQPIHNQNQRAQILAGFRMVDLVVKIPYFSSDKDYFELVYKIKPKIIAVTEGDPQIKNKIQQAEKIGGKVITVSSLIKKFSTRKIISKFL